MKRLIIALLFVSSSANAYCFCACEYGEAVVACTKPLDIPPPALMCNLTIC